MLIIKMLGSLMIILSCGVIGNSIASKYTGRFNNLRILKNCIHLLETEIIYSATPLPDAMDNVYRKGNKKISFIFNEIRKYLINHKNENVSDSCSYILKSVKEKLNLRNEDVEILISLGRVLGISDKADQQKHFKIAILQLQEQEKEAQESMKKNEDMYKKLGILVGLAIVIVLF